MHHVGAILDLRNNRKYLEDGNVTNLLHVIQTCLSIGGKTILSIRLVLD